MYIFTRQFHSQAYFITLILMAMSLPLSRFTMSVFQFTLLGLWIWSGYSFEVVFRIFRRSSLPKGLWHFVVYMLRLTRHNLQDKFGHFFKNPIAVLVSSLFLLHLLGLIHTQDFSYAIKDLRIKLPILLLPIVLATMEKISRRQLHFLLLFYVLAVFIGTLFSLNAYLQQEFTDIREISLFINPVRFSLNIVFSFFILLWFVFYKTPLKQIYRMAFLVLMGWFVLFLAILESMIGMLSLLLLTMGLLIARILSLKQRKLRLALVLLIVALPAAVLWHVYGIVQELSTPEPVKLAQLPTHTQQGNPYLHDTLHFGVEDGRYIGLFLSFKELEEAWNRRSEIKYHELDRSDQEIKHTLIRYLHSRKLPKDAAGVEALTEQDIAWIERGIANYNYVTRPSLRTRISKILIAYQKYDQLQDPGGSSVLQRLEYIKASKLIISENFWFGVGTGDLPAVFAETYDRLQSPLKEMWRWRSHNQYLSIFVAFGVFGFVWFMIILIYPFIACKAYQNYFYSIFLALIMISMLTEDTIESQDGVTLFAFFSALLLFGIKEEDKAEKQ